jgi:hypothetical protein
MDAQKNYTPARTWVMVRVRGHKTEVECAELTAKELQDRLDSGWFVNPATGSGTRRSAPSGQVPPSRRP